jgi:tRNA pseudouridine(55) synthase
MIELYKKKSETPLQALERLRIEMPELAHETLSYAGRLDPMAEGIIPVLVGEEENKNRHTWLESDKEYKAEFVLGVTTDTGDMLGLVERVDFKKVDEKLIVKTFKNLLTLTNQTYPWYSSKTVAGKALFEYAREGNKEIERPTRDIKIYSIRDIVIKEVDLNDVILNSIEDIKRVEGDFRQGEIITKWEEVMTGQAKPAPHIQLISCTLKVSSGTYIRGLCETLESQLDVPVVLHSLVRTQVFV